MYTGRGTIVVKKADGGLDQTKDYERVWFEAPVNADAEEVAVNATVKEGGVSKKKQVGTTVRPKLTKEQFEALKAKPEQVQQLIKDAVEYFEQTYADEIAEEGSSGELRLLMAASYGNDLWTRASYQKELRPTVGDLSKTLERTAKVMVANKIFPDLKTAMTALAALQAPKAEATGEVGDTDVDESENGESQTAA